MRLTRKGIVVLFLRWTIATLIVGVLLSSIMSFFFIHDEDDLTLWEAIRLWICAGLIGGLEVCRALHLKKRRHLASGSAEMKEF